MCRRGRTDQAHIVMAPQAFEASDIYASDPQLDKARRLAARDGYANARFEKGYIEQAPVADESATVVISNGVINRTCSNPSCHRRWRWHRGSAGACSP